MASFQNLAANSDAKRGDMGELSTINEEAKLKVRKEKEKDDLSSSNKKKRTTKKQKLSVENAHVSNEIRVEIKPIAVVENSEKDSEFFLGDMGELSTINEKAKSKVRKEKKKDDLSSSNKKKRMTKKQKLSVENTHDSIERRDGEIQPMAVAKNSKKDSEFIMSFLLQASQKVEFHADTSSIKIINGDLAVSHYRVPERFMLQENETYLHKIVKLKFVDKSLVNSTEEKISVDECNKKDEKKKKHSSKEEKEKKKKKHNSEEEKEKKKKKHKRTR